MPDIFPFHHTCPRGGTQGRFLGEIDARVEHRTSRELTGERGAVVAALARTLTTATRSVPNVMML
jgi:hypothetical protein